MKPMREFFVFTIFEPFKKSEGILKRIRNFNSEYAAEQGDDVLILIRVWI